MGVGIGCGYSRRVKLAKIIAKNVRNRRLFMRISQETLAEEAHFQTRYLQDLEAGVRDNLMLATIERLAESLDVEPHQLLTLDFFPEQPVDRAPRKRAQGSPKRARKKGHG